MPTALHLHAATFASLDPPTLYVLLKLRVDVFVVEQQSPYPELDGRDVEPTTRHLWLAGGDGPVGYLRIVTEPDGAARLGRVVVARPHRGRGHGGRLLAAALAEVGERECRLASQSAVAGLYRRYGFEVTGPEFDDTGVPHVPMRRPATAGQ